MVNGAPVDRPDEPAGKGSVRVDLTLKGSLAAWLPEGHGRLELPAGTTVDGVLPALGASPVHCIYVVNGAPAARGTPLRDGDRLVVYPPMAGGSVDRRGGAPVAGASAAGASAAGE